MDSNYLSITSGVVWEKAYSLDNYLIECTNKDSDYCVIYFSSSGIYYPNTEEELQKLVDNKKHYEWMHHKITKAKKNIFIRDVAKQFYVIGINEKISTIDRLIEFLKRETSGYKLITVGSSGGGYIAALVGAVLKADYSFCFSAFFSLNIVNQEIWYLLKYNKDKKYYELGPFIKKAEDTCFFYIYPALSNDSINNDNLQCKIVKDLTNVYSFPIRTKEHGICISIDSLDAFINSSKEKLISMHSGIALKNQYL